MELLAIILTDSLIATAGGMPRDMDQSTDFCRGRHNGDGKSTSCCDLMTDRCLTYEKGKSKTSRLTTPVKKGFGWG